MPDSKIVVLGGMYTLSAEGRAVIERGGGRVVQTPITDVEELSALCEDADALLAILLPIPEKMIARLTRCKIIARVGVGYDNIDLEAAKARGIPVTNVPDYCTNEVADHALSLALALARQLPFLDRSVRSDDWIPILPSPMPAFETLNFGIVGLGRIGKAAVQRARAFRFRLLACDPYLPDADFAAVGAEKRGLDELLVEADIVSLHTPLTPETRHLLNPARLAKMKPTAILVNTARGSLIDTFVLADALQSGRLAAAGIDVFETEPLPADHPLRACPNALLTPHFAWHSALSKEKLHVLAAEEVVRALHGEPVKNRVN